MKKEKLTFRKIDNKKLWVSGITFMATLFSLSYVIFLSLFPSTFPLLSDIILHGLYEFYKKITRYTYNQIQIMMAAKGRTLWRFFVYFVRLQIYKLRQSFSFF